MAQNTQITTIKQLTSKPSIQAKINELCGKNASSFIATMNQIAQSYVLAKCEPMSVLGAGITAATLNLSCNPTLGQAYIVPYGNKAQFQIGYKGLIQLALRSGQVRNINEFVVGAGQFKSYNPITGHLDVDFNVNQEGDPDGYGVYLELVNGFRKIVYWPYKKVVAHAKRFSQAYRNGKDCPWKTDFEAMALKTVIKATLSKYAPMSTEMQQAVSADQGVIDIETGEIEYPDNPEQLEVVGSEMPEMEDEEEENEEKK